MFKIQKFDLLASIYIGCICIPELMRPKTPLVYAGVNLLKKGNSDGSN